MAVAQLLAPRPVFAQRGTLQQERPEVRELRILGTRAVSGSELRVSLATQPSSCRSLILRPFCLFTKSRYIFERKYLDRDEFKVDVLRALVFYFKRGYRDVQVDTSITRLRDNSVRVTLSIIEGPATRLTVSEIFDSARVIPARDSSRELRPVVGQPLNLLAVDSTIVRLRQALWERGFADAVITPHTTVDTAASTGTLRISVDPKRRVTIGDVTIVGNERISEETIRRSMRVETGDVFRTSQIGRSQRALYESALFQRAIIDTMPRAAGIADSVKPLVVRLQEAPQREVSTSIGFTTADFVQAEGRFVHNYLLNGPRRLDASLTIGNLLAQELTRSRFFVDFANIAQDSDIGRYYAPTYQASVDLRQRWFGSPRNTVGAGLFAHRRSSPGVFVDRGYGASATFTRELTVRTPLSGTYRFEISSVEAGDVYFCVNYGVCDASTIQALKGEQRMSPIAVALNLDRSNSPFSPTQGIRLRAEVEHASQFTASDFRHNRAMVDLAGYLPLPFRRSVGAAHLRAGWVRPLAGTAEAVGLGNLGETLEFARILHPRKRFYAGGSQSVRGFGENQLGPRVLTIAPDKLRGRAISGADTTWVCPPTAAITQCDPSAVQLRARDFQVRPLGGTTLLEGSIELRMPVWRSVVAAVFVDGAILGEGSLGMITKGTGAITPGFGVRYESPVGPIRVDLGVRPTLRRALPVITQTTDSAGRRVLVSLSPETGCVDGNTAGCRTYPDPAEKLSFFRALPYRLTLHLSIGQAF